MTATESIAHPDQQYSVPPGWQLRSLHDIASLERGKFSARPRNDPRYFGGAYPFIQTGDVTNSGGVVTAYSQTLNDDGLRVSRLFPPHTLFFTIAANIGDLAVAPFATACPDSLIAIAPRHGIDQMWLFYGLASHKAAFEKLATQNAQLNITLEKLRPYQVAVPPLPEQRAISAALGDADALVGALDRLIAKKRDLKQAAMQQLLTGQTRLPGFASNWKRLPLGALGAWFSGGTPPKANETLWNGDIPWVSPKDMKVARIHETIDHVSERAIGNGTRLLPSGAILIVVRGMILAHSAPVARAERPVAFNQDIKALVVREDIDSTFVLWWLVAHEGVLLSLTNEATHGTKRLPTDGLFKLDIGVPPFDEQSAIAQAVSDIDAELAALQRRRDKARLLKQGMMQELLTGRTRLV